MLYRGPPSKPEAMHGVGHHPLVLMAFPPRYPRFPTAELVKVRAICHRTLTHAWRVLGACWARARRRFALSRRPNARVLPPLFYNRRSNGHALPSFAHSPPVTSLRPSLMAVAYIICSLRLGEICSVPLGV